MNGPSASRPSKARIAEPSTASHPSQRRSLYRLVWGLGLSMTAAFAAVVLTCGRGVRAEIEAQVAQKVESVGRMFAAAAAGPITSFDYGALESYERAILADPDFCSATFV
ncbi:MAG TPA: hypothetical protein VEI02_01110, partial [Planctomycetota bacterium]|nr:hypothetical protein [Planctomycetota bacterium]